VATPDVPDPRKIHLDRLAVVLGRRGWKATLDVGARDDLELKVVNPHAAELSERIRCRRGPDGAWSFQWSWGERIASVDHLTPVADRIVHVLHCGARQ
jgi:hypothetical protein